MLRVRTDFNLPWDPCGAGSDRRLSWWGSRIPEDTACGKLLLRCCRQATVFAPFSSAAWASFRRNIFFSWGSFLLSRQTLRPHIPTR